MKFTIIGLPLIILAMSYNIVSRYFEVKKKTWDLAESAEQKIALLKSVKYTQCGIYYTQSQNLLRVYCYSKDSKEECKLSELQLQDLQEYNKSLESMIAECIRLQNEQELQITPTSTIFPTTSYAPEELPIQTDSY